MSTTLTTLSGKMAAKFSVDASEVGDILKKTAFKGELEITDEQMAALMIICDQYGLNPFTKEIYAYPDKGSIVPVVGVDGWSRIINEHPQFDGIEFKYSQETTVMSAGQAAVTCHDWVECIIYRKDRERPTVVREYLDEVYRSTTYASPWKTHPKRMHRHKTLIQCARVAFGFSGIYDQDEAERIIEVNEKPLTETTAQPMPEAHEQAEPEGDIVYAVAIPMLTPKMLKYIREKGCKAHNIDELTIAMHFSAESLDDVPAEKFQEVKDFIKQAVETMKKVDQANGH